MTRVLGAAAIACTSACIAIPSPPACTVRPLTEVNSVKDEAGPWLSPDHLELFFASTSNTNLYQMYRATRTSVEAQFSQPVNVFGDGNNSYEDPFLSDDERTMWFALNGRISIATRTDRASDFGTPSTIPNQPATHQSQFHPSVTADLLTLVYADRYQPITQLSMMTRASPAADFANPTSIDTIATGNDPTIARDGASLLFDSVDADGTQIHRAVKSASGFVDTGAITAPGHVVGSDDFDGTPDADGHTMVFTSDRIGGLGQGDVWIACE